ncbi:MAG: 4Fe-4S dicluster domain-containing protein, partial [Anaerolineae bacterium]|nr:4Fe-4S dicluster domain-containing protein [Anaerolineae bacterium]
MIVELLWARCPDAEVFRQLGAQYGVEKPRFEPREGELCYLCGLCVRFCDEVVGANAISFTGRGVDREIGTPFYKMSEACIACGACEFVCPTGAIKVTDVTDKEPRPLLLDFDMGLRGRGNIFIPFPQAVPNVPVIDRQHCLHFQADACGVCSLVCPPGAVDYEQEDEFIEVGVGAVVVATGFDPFDAKEKPEFGYGRYHNVITGLEFERLASASGPTKGKIQLNGTVPKELVFVHC